MAFAQLFSDPAIASDRRYSELMIAFEEIALETMRDSFDLDEVLLLVGRRLCELLEVTRCSVYLRRDDGLFAGRAAWSNGEDIGEPIRNLIAGVSDDLFTAEILATAAPVLITDARRDNRTIQRTMRQWGVHAMLGVPLAVGEEIIGIIYVDNQNDAHVYNDHEIAVAQAFASLAAVAVQQGRLHSELEERARIVHHQRDQMEKLAAVHSRLTHAVLGGANLATLLGHVSELVGKPVLLYSTDVELTAWSAPAELGLTRPPELPPRAREVPWMKRTLAEVQASRSAVLVPPAPELGSPNRRVMSPLTIEGKQAGLLEIVELGRRVTAFDAKVLEYAAMAVALQLLTEQRQVEAEGQARQDFLADLLHGYREAPQLRRRAPLFGLDLKRLSLVVRVAYEEAGHGTTGSRRREQVAAVLHDLLGGPSTLLATGVPGADLFLVGVPFDEEVESLEHRLSRSLPALAPFGCRAVLVSPPCRDVETLPGAAHDLRQLDEMLRSEGAPSQVAFTGRLGLVRLLASQQGLPDARRFASRLLAPIREADGDRGHLMSTLVTYLEHGGQIRAASRALDVHENTVRYRLTRIRELSNVNTEDFETLVDARFAIQLLELFGELPPLRTADDKRPTKPRIDPG